MSDRFTEVTTRGYGSRLMGAISGVVVGLGLFAGAFPLILWNEENAVRTFSGLAEGLDATISVDAGAVLAENEGKLVHFLGRAETKTPIVDDTFGLQAPDTLRLRRTVEIYQWQETSETRTVKELGGSERTETTYEYRKVWREGWIDSSKFRHPEGHENSQPRYSSTEFNAESAAVGAIAIPRGLITQLGDFSPLPVSNPISGLPEGYSVSGEFIRTGQQSAPRLGDERVSFQAVAEGDITAVAEQSGATLKPFRTSQGTDIFAAYHGRLSKEQVFDREETKASIMTWLFRALGFGMMLFGLMLVLRPLSVLADVIPLVGSIVGGGVAIVSFVVASPIWFLTTAFAWLAYRPLLSIGLAVGGVLLSIAVIMIRKAFSGKAEPAADTQPAETG